MIIEYIILGWIIGLINAALIHLSILYSIQKKENKI
jgi:hypothetical protein